MRKRRKPAVRRSNPIPDWVVWALAAAFTVSALVTGVLVYDTVRNLAASWSDAGLPELFRPLTGGEPQVVEGTEVLTPVPTVSLDIVAEPWNGTDRVNILLMGLDFRDWQRGEGPPRTDSMMLVTLDPISRTGGMLSIPRDLWVEIPGFEHNRINTAYFLGEANRLPGGGPGLAMKTVEGLLGVPIEYYAVIEFSTFERMIDEIGGIELWIEEDIRVATIDAQGKGHSLLLEGGKGHKLNGSEALAYARARKSGGGDFDRAQRQQQVAMAIRNQILDLDMIPTLLSKAPNLYQELATGIRTNLTFDQMVSLGLLALQVSVKETRKGVIAPPDMVTFETLPDGAQVLKPVTDRIRLLRDNVFTGGAIGPSEVAQEDPLQAAVLEGARLAVYNGAGVEGLATETSEYLTQQGLNVVQVANADRSDFDKSRVIVQSQNYPFTVRFLASTLGLSQGQILNPVTSQGDVDLVVILGADWAYADRP